MFVVYLPFPISRHLADSYSTGFFAFLPLANTEETPIPEYRLRLLDPRSRRCRMYYGLWERADVDGHILSWKSDNRPPPQYLYLRLIMNAIARRPLGFTNAEESFQLMRDLWPTERPYLRKSFVKELVAQQKKGAQHEQHKDQPEVLDFIPEGFDDDSSQDRTRFSYKTWAVPSLVRVFVHQTIKYYEHNRKSSDDSNGSISIHDPDKQSYQKVWNGPQECNFGWSKAEKLCRTADWVRDTP